jgi:hypothetical protein
MRYYWHHGCPVAPSGLHVDPQISADCLQGRYLRTPLI